MSVALGFAALAACLTGNAPLSYALCAASIASTLLGKLGDSVDPEGGWW